MPRLKKPRRCGCKMKGRAFRPVGVPGGESVTLYRDELEALRLCDMWGLTQEQAGRKMGVSRGTVQRILAGAREKTATALTSCRSIVFECRKTAAAKRRSSPLR